MFWGRQWELVGRKPSEFWRRRQSGLGGGPHSCDEGGGIIQWSQIAVNVLAGKVGAGGEEAVVNILAVATGAGGEKALGVFLPAAGAGGEEALGVLAAVAGAGGEEALTVVTRAAA